jgi:MFS family permease
VTSSLGLLGRRDFRILFTSECVSVLGDALVPVALAFAVLDLTGSASDLGLVLLSYLAPRVVFMLAGGVWADRLPHRRLMIATHLARFVTQGAQGLMLVTGHASIGTLVALQVARGTAAAFYRPAASAIVPSVVPREDLQPANALLWMAWNLSGVAGPTIAGVLVATVGSGWAILGDSASFLVAALFLQRLDTVERGRASARARAGFWTELAEGWSEVRSRTWVWASILYFACFQLVYLSSFSVLGPVVSERSLGGATAWALIAAAAALGGLIGNAAMLRVRPRRPLLVANGSVFLAVPSLVLLALAAPAPLIATAELGAGIAVGMATALWETTLQRGIPPEALSRVISYDQMGSIALRPIGLALVGPIVAVAGTRGTLLGAAAVVAAATLAILSIPSIRRVRSDERAEPFDLHQAAGERDAALNTG